MEVCKQETREATSRLQKSESKLSLSEKELEDAKQDRKTIDAQLILYESLQKQHAETLLQVDDLKRLNGELATQNSSLQANQNATAQVYAAELCRNLEREKSNDLADAQSTIKTYLLFFSFSSF